MKVLRRGVIFVEETVPAILLSAVAAVVVYGVVMRYGFDKPPTWTNELAEVLFVWSLCLATAGAARKHLHLGVEALATRLSGRARAVQELVAGGLVLVTLAFFIYLGPKLSMHPTKELQMIGLNYRYIYLAVPVGFGLVGVHVLQDMVQAVRGLLAGEYVPPSSSLDGYTDMQTEGSTTGAAL